MQFKKNKSFEEREKEALRIKEIHPDRIPVIVERSTGCKNVPQIEKNKYLVPTDLTVGQFMYVIRKRIKLDEHKGLFLFVNNTMPPTSEFISTIYERHRDKDYFLYISYSGENTFG